MLSVCEDHGVLEGLTSTEKCPKQDAAAGLKDQCISSAAFSESLLRESLCFNIVELPCHYCLWFIMGTFNVSNDCQQGSSKNSLPAHCTELSQGLATRQCSALESSVSSDDGTCRVSSHLGLSLVRLLAESLLTFLI